MTSPKKARSKKARTNSPKRDSARLLAVKVLSRWLFLEPGKRGEIECLADEVLRGAHLSEKDKGLFWNILIGTVRWLRLLRWHLERYIKRFSKLPKDVQAILLTGAFQIVFLSRIPFFSAVDEAVKITKVLGHFWATGLVNASLRNLARGNKVVILHEEGLMERCESNFENCLSNLTSHPHWMVKRWHRQWGKTDCVSICVNNNIQPDLVIRVNTLRTTREELAITLAKAGITTQNTAISPFGLRLDGFKGQIEEIPGLSQGFFQVQDESSQLATMLVSPSRGDKVLDVCAGVGGKTTFLAQLMENTGLIAACDINDRRLGLLKDNCKRLGITCVKSFNLSEDEKEVNNLAPFDRILVDAPCSGLGVIRRHPDIKWNRLPKDIDNLSVIQLDLLTRWSSLLRPGGLLVYCVCTHEKRETNDVITSFLDSYGNFQLVSVDKVLPTLPFSVVKQKFMFIRPGVLGMDGFFAAVLQKLF